MNKFNNDLLKEYPDVLTGTMIMEILCIGKTHTYKLLKTGEIRSFKIGREYRILKVDLISYLLKKIN